MAFVTPRMSLKVWNAAQDPYDHEQLADNFLKLDQHDHSFGRGTQIPAGGIADGAITATKLAPSVDPAPYYLSYKALCQQTGQWSGSLTANQYVSFSYGTAQGSNFPQTGSFYFDPAPYVVPGKTLKLRIYAWVYTGTFTGGGTWQVFLSGATATTSGILSLGATAAFTGLPAGGGVATSGDINAPAAGLYTFGVQNSASGSGIYNVGCRLEYRHV